MLAHGIDFQYSASNMLNEQTRQEWPARRILLVEHVTSASAPMDQKLALFDCYQTERISSLESMPTIVRISKPDLLVLSVETLKKVDFSSLSWLKESHPIPVIVFAQKNSVCSIKSLVDAGVSTYIVDDVLPERLPVIIGFSFERFTQMQTVSLELEKTKRKLAERKMIEKAKGFIMLQKNCSEDQAYIEMRKSAMDQGVPMSELSARIISVFDGIFD